MATEKGKGYRRRKNCKSRDKNAKISLEDYLHLLHSRNHSHLCVNFLNQIISMHGYKKIHKTTKKVVAEALNTLALVNPGRSTLGDGISPSVLATIDDVVEDLEELNWKECTVTSIQTLNSAATHGLAIYTSPEPARRCADRAKVRGTRRKALVPIENGGAVQKVRLPRKAMKRMKPIVAAMSGGFDGSGKSVW